jgi:hypothetical protein
MSDNKGFLYIELEILWKIPIRENLCMSIKKGTIEVVNHEIFPIYFKKFKKKSLVFYARKSP